MQFVDVDGFSADVYRCIETGILWKDLMPDSEQPSLYSCGNEIDGDPCYPINPKFEIHLVGKPVRPNPADRFDYMLLDRLRTDCEYYLGYGNRYAGHLWAKDEKKQIEKMKELYDGFSDNKKPEWLPYEKILEYEKLMVKEEWI